jgi:hypothetical protein
MNHNFDVIQHDKAVQLDSVPSPASEPFLVATERRVALAYRIADRDFDLYGPFGDGDEPFCVVLFSEADFHRLGPPGAEEIEVHPLSSQGLRSNSGHEVMNSSLVAEGWEVAAEHMPLRHFVWTFQDTTFECVAADYTVAGVFGSGDIASREAFALVR